MSIVAPRIRPLADIVETDMPAPQGQAEGVTRELPITLYLINLEDFEAYCEIIYNPNLILMTSKKPVLFWLGILRLGSMWGWDEAVKYASACINECGNQELDPYEKLLLGIKHNMPSWVYSALQSLYFHGNLPRPANKKEYNNIIPVEQWEPINWTLQEGSKLLEKTVHELVQHAPRLPAGDDAEWEDHKCADHQACVNALVSEWYHVRNNVPNHIRAQGGQYGLTYDLMDSIEQYKFKGMDPRCRTSIMRDLSSIVYGFYDRICCAVGNRMLGIEEEEVQP
ncbi:hypothetical protein VKT23_020278 [Stygiomarasmius scandens]|uniref:Uncharacterized protein n=1 Tax=Marasmiellus scandens TaxID=2682957 RepID=A0ABR1IL85_9AGAR